MQQRTDEEILAALAEPFDATEVKWKPAVVSGNRAMALAYVDARVVQDRLDEVLGVAGWQDDYETRDDGSVVCKLSCLIGGQWIKKVDVGSPSEQSDGGDRLKAAFSDALKRAAVKFGIGRFLYRLPQQWVDYDPHKRKFVRDPQLPANLFAPKATTPKAQEPKKPEPTPEQGAEAEELRKLMAERKELRSKTLPVLEAAAKQGFEALAAAWELLSKPAKAACLADKDRLKKEATHAATV